MFCEEEDLLVLDRDNPRSLGWVAQTLRGRLARLAGSPPGVMPVMAMTVPDPQHWALEPLCERDAEGRHAALRELLQQCVDASFRLSDDLSARYFGRLRPLVAQRWRTTSRRGPESIR